MKLAQCAWLWPGKRLPPIQTLQNRMHIFSNWTFALSSLPQQGHQTYSGERCIDEQVCIEKVANSTTIFGKIILKLTNLEIWQVTLLQHSFSGFGLC